MSDPGQPCRSCSSRAGSMKLGTTDGYGWTQRRKVATTWGVKDGKWLMADGKNKCEASIVRICLGVVAGSLLLWVAGCSHSVTTETLIVAQSPRATAHETARDELDLRYPRGSRVVLTGPSEHEKVIRVLSTGLAAAGEPVILYNGRSVVFAGKPRPSAQWQIFEAGVNGGAARALTSVAGGAKDPALLPDGSLVFVSPVAQLAPKDCSARASALYALSPGGKPRQLTFGMLNVGQPTILSDGRILFVADRPGLTGASPALALYTINNDGTEISAFTGQHDQPSLIQRPRQLPDGRIAFVTLDPTSRRPVTAETVLSARPFASRAPLFPNLNATICAVEPAGNGELLVCAKPVCRDESSGAWAVFRLGHGLTPLGSPIIADPAWNSTEAVSVSSSRRPMGRLSNVDFSHSTGQILCLDVNDTTYSAGKSRATRVRVFTTSPSAARYQLGEVPVQADGSFMAEVPADLPLGFEALDESGQVLRRDPAFMWVRPGENRSCIGCHEPHNHSPRNARPLAVRVPVPRLCGEPVRLAQGGRE